VISAAAPRSPDALFRDNRTASSTCGPVPRYRLSMEGYKYVLLLEDHASKFVWSFPLKDRTAPEILVKLKTFLTHDLPTLVIQLDHFHSDGGSELISELVRTFLHAKGTTTSHTPRDTPEMKFLLKRKVRDLKEHVMSMLLDSTLPVSFWWMAWKTACYLQNRMPTVTAYGYMTRSSVSGHSAQPQPIAHLGVQDLRPEAQGGPSEGFRRQGLLGLPCRICRR
jgi:hypothetical protein